MALKKLKYFAIRRDGFVIIKKSVSTPKKVVSKITIPRLPGSPLYNTAGYVHKGTTLTQIEYSGGTTIGIIPAHKFAVRTNMYIAPGNMMELVRPYKARVLHLLDNLESL